MPMDRTSTGHASSSSSSRTMRIWNGNLHRHLLERRRHLSRGRASSSSRLELAASVMLDEDRRWALLEESELCLVCKSFAASSVLCRSCYEIHSQSYGVWKAWIEREQNDYQQHMGCTYSNLRWDSVVIQRGCVVNPELLLLKRVKACIGWAVHGLIFEFLDGTRAGYVVDVHSIRDDEAIDKRRSTDWIDIPMGDYIRTVRGNNLSRGCFLCHTLHLDFASGRTISFASTHDPWKGETFRYDLPENALLHHVSFREGKCLGITAADSIMHLPVKSQQRVSFLGRTHRATFQLLQLVANRIDHERAQAGEHPLGRDLWLKIVCEYLACFDLQPFETSAIGKLRKRDQQGALAQAQDITL